MFAARRSLLAVGARRVRHLRDAAPRSPPAGRPGKCAARTAAGGQPRALLATEPSRDDDHDPFLSAATNLSSLGSLIASVGQGHVAWLRRKLDSEMDDLSSLTSDERALVVARQVADGRFEQLRFTARVLLGAVEKMGGVDLSIGDLISGLTSLAVSRGPETSVGGGASIVTNRAELNGLLTELEIIRLATKPRLMFRSDGSVNPRAALSPDDIVCGRLDAAHLRPAFVLCRPAGTDALYVVVRGTNDMNDLLTNLACEGEAALDGIVHHGMYVSAETLLDELWPIIRVQLAERPSTRLHFVGHSLGGAVAAIMALKLRRMGVQGIDALGFGPAAAMSVDLAEECKDFATSIVLQDDLVPRFALGQIEALIRDMKRNRQRLPRLGFGDPLNHPFLFPAGNVLHLIRGEPEDAQAAGKQVKKKKEKKAKKKDGAASEEPVRVYRKDPSDFDQIELSTTMLIDHVTRSYRDGIVHATQQLQSE